VRKLNLALVAVASVLAFGLTPVQAGTTCKYIPAMCPPPPGGDRDEPRSGGDRDDPRSVPEPVTLVVLAAGAAAAGLAARGRNKK